MYVKTFDGRIVKIYQDNIKIKIITKKEILYHSYRFYFNEVNGNDLNYIYKEGKIQHINEIIM